jgi:hypothetical protein
MSGRGIIYILSNPAMPGLIKIGTTKNLDDRLGELYNTSVPYPFECVYACQVDDYQSVEKAIHNICDVHRVNSKREFFDIAPEKVVAVLEQLKAKDVTGEIEKKVEQEINGDTALEEKAIREVSSQDRIPSGYKTYKELKENLIEKEGFRPGYFGVRVAALHTRKKAVYYQFNRENFYNPVIFFEQAKSEGILKEPGETNC